MKNTKTRNGIIIGMVLIVSLATFNLNFAQLIKNYFPQRDHHISRIIIVEEDNNPAAIIPSADYMNAIEIPYQNDIVTEELQKQTKKNIASKEAIKQKSLVAMGEL